jgi:hypothetical protein
MEYKTGIVKTLVPAVIFCINLAGAGILQAETQPFEYDIFIYNDRLTVDFNFKQMFSDEIVESIKEGFPLHIDLEVILKKSKSLWFDPAFKRYDCHATIEFKAFGARYSIFVRNFQGDALNESFKNIDELKVRLNEALLLVCDEVRDYDPGDNLYFEFNLELRRLTAREITNAGNWYSGTIRDDTGSGKKSPKFQQKIFEQLVDITGMGPEKHHFSGFIFKVIDLKEVRP